VIVTQPEWEGRLVRLVSVGGLPMSLAPPYRTDPRRTVDAVYVATTGGARGVGDAAVLSEHVRATSHDPTVGGRGLPGVPWTFLVPSAPVAVAGRAVVYRLHGDDVFTPHTGGLWDDHTISVAVCGTYTSRHDQGLPTRDTELDPTALAALEELVTGYLLPRFGLAPTQIRGPWDAGEPAAAGDALEVWARAARGEPVHRVAGDTWVGDLSTWGARGGALARLGAAVSDGGTPASIATAVERVCRAAGAPVERRWTVTVEHVVRQALARLDAGQWPVLPSPHVYRRG
jgi:hypothetical protein